ncbi:MAG: PAS domain-containing protein [Chloroflexi bacterium]|nr:MAG: PAS domain-containing protein [Chloroflexota bacterium]
MNWQFNPLVIVIGIAFLISLSVLVYAWRRRNSHGARPFLPLMLGITIWLLSNGIEAGFTNETTRLFWNNMQYLGIVMVPTAWFLFTAIYTGHSKRITKKFLSLLFIEPITIIILVWTSQWHQIFRQYMILNTTGGTPIWEWAPGPAFWVHTIYSYTLLITGVILLIQAYMRSSRLYKRQISVLLVGALVPWIANIVFIARGGSSTIDPTPLSFLATGLMIAWGIFGFGLVEIAPIARERVFEKINDIILILDDQNRIIDVNPAFRQRIKSNVRITGQPVENVLEQWPDLVSKFTNVNHIETAISLMTEDGTEKHYQLSISPLYDAKERYSGRLVMLHDITPLKETESRLRQSREAAEAANQAKSAFLATMSHELRTPLAAIIGYSELITEKSKVWGYENIVPYLSQIETAARHLNTIIGEILDISKIEAGRMELIKSDFSLQDVLDDVINTIYPLIEKNGNQLLQNIQIQSGTMYADKTKVQQILINLLGNAAKFTKNGQISLDVHYQPANNGSSDSYHFKISDTGEGIPNEKMDVIFKPFVQVDSSYTRKHGGTGLGLAISYQFCQMIGGEMHVESTLGQGTTFYLTLPAKVANEQKSGDKLPTAG